MIKYRFFPIFLSALVCINLVSLAPNVKQIFNAIKKRDSYPLWCALNRGPTWFDVNQADAEGFTVLHHYASYGDKPYLMKKLAEKNADFNACNNRGETPFLVAIKNGNFDGAFLLLRHGADPRVSDFQGKNCLHVMFENEMLVRVLNQAVANCQVPEAVGANARKIVTETNVLIQRLGYFPTLKERVIKKFSQGGVLSTLIASGISPEIKEHLLLHAFNNECAWAVGLAKALDIEPHIYTWIHQKFIYNNQSLLRSPINARDQDGYIPLHYAARNHLRLPFIQYLQQYGAFSAAHANKEGKYPYQFFDEQPCSSLCSASHEPRDQLHNALMPNLTIGEFLYDQNPTMPKEKD